MEVCMILVGNGTLVTRDSNNSFYEDGAVAIEGTKIKEVGSTADLKAKYSDADFVDAKNGIIMPAFINMHEHIYSAFARALSINGYSPKGLLDILNGQWWKIDRNLDNKQNYWSAKVSYMDCIKSGITTVFDHHASFGEIPDSLFAIGQAAVESGVRTCLCYEISDRDGKEKALESVLENEKWAKHALADDSDMIAGMMGMHAQFTISDETFELARAHKPEGIGYHIHVAEGIEDLHACLKDHKKRIVNRLMDNDILGEKTLLGHCIYVNKQEMELIKETDTMVVHNPESNMGNACGCPPTMDIVQKGILCGLGTDGYPQDMIRSYLVCNVLHKHSLCDPNAAWGEVPKMLFENNPKMANRYFKNKLGVIEQGAAADVIVMDYDPRTPLRADNINGHIMFGMQSHDCRTTICNGKVLYKDFEFTEIDEAEINAKCREESARLHAAVNA